MEGDGSRPCQYQGVPQGPAESTAPQAWLARVASLAGVESPLPAGSLDDLDATADVIERRHGTAGARFTAEAFDFDTDRLAVFEAKNATLALSVDVSLTWNLPLYVHELALIAELLEEHRPRQVVDLGCEQGIVTCFAAATSPDADVIGIDRSGEALARADELAELLGVANIRFAPGDVTTPDRELDDLIGESRRPRLVIASRSMVGEALPETDDAGWGAIAGSAARAVASLIGADDRLLLVERGGRREVGPWFEALAAAGVEQSRSLDSFRCDEPANPDQEFTLAVGRGSGGPPPTRIS